MGRHLNCPVDTREKPQATPMAFLLYTVGKREKREQGEDGFSYAVAAEAFYEADKE